MNQMSYTLIFFMSLLLVACASNQNKAPEIKEELSTKIEKNGLKLFTYTVTMAMPEDRSGGMRGNGMGRGMRGGGGRMEGGMRGEDVMNGSKKNREAKMTHIKNLVYEKLNTKLTETGYCRESYTEINKFFIKGRLQIRGECNESATEEDRLAFINDKNT